VSSTVAATPLVARRDLGVQVTFRSMTRELVTTDLADAWAERFEMVSPVRVPRGPSRDSATSRARGGSYRRHDLAGSYVILVTLNFVWFWPIWTGALLTHSEWLDRMWFERWI